MDYLKFKLKFDLRSYFFYFNLSLFKTLTSNSLFLTLFHLNIHYFFFYYFLNSQNTFLSHFPLLSPYIPLYIPYLFFFFSHHPQTTSLLFPFFFFPPLTYPLPFFLLLPHSNFININPATSAKKKLSEFTNFHRNITENNSKFTNFHSNITKNIKTRPAHQSKITHKPSPSLIWRRRRTSKRSRGRRRKRRERETVATRVGSIALTATEQTK